MDDHLARELAALTQLGVSELRLKYAEVFGEPTRTGNAETQFRRSGSSAQPQRSGSWLDRALEGLGVLVKCCPGS
jgi:hypothetical protein